MHSYAESEGECWCAIKDVEIISSSKEQTVSGYTEKCPLKSAAKFPVVSPVQAQL